MTVTRYMQHSSGLTLTELLMALMVSSVLVTAVIQAYLAAVTHFQWLNQHLNEAQSLQLAVSILANSAQQAGFCGCAHATTSSDLSREPGLQIYHQADLQLPSSVRRNAIPGSVVFAVSFVDPSEITIAQSITADRLCLFDEPKFEVLTEAGLLICNCQQRWWRQVSYRIDDRCMQLNLPISQLVKPPMFVGPLITRYFYLRAVENTRGLFIYESGRSEELVRGIESMSLSWQGQTLKYRLQGRYALFQGEWAVIASNLETQPLELD